MTPRGANYAEGSKVKATTEILTLRVRMTPRGATAAGGPDAGGYEDQFSGDSMVEPMYLASHRWMGI